MLSRDGRAERVLLELAEMPLATDDVELAAVAVALHLEEALEVIVPPELLTPEHLVAERARARTVHRLLGGL